MEKVKVRFAPSPTGPLHVGNARTAIFNWLFAKKFSGKFVLRIEDTDLERSKKSFENELIYDLRWLGLDWDEGPDVGGESAPYRQSERLSIYKEFTEKLIKDEMLYPCFCTKERLSLLKEEQLREGKPPKYDGRCRNLSKKEIDSLISQGKEYVLRFKVDEEETLFIDDVIHGVVQFSAKNIGGDFVVVRSDGMPVYNYIVVIDDYLMGITHVIRGEDHLSNTPKQLLIAKALGIKPPIYAHHPLIFGPDRTKLSKRHGPTSVRNYKEAGFLPEALFNYLALLGWATSSGKEILTKEEIIEEFSLEKLSKSSAVFDFAKLRWVNSVYIKNLSKEELYKRALPFLEKEYDISKFDEAFLKEAIFSVRGGLSELSSLPKSMEIFLDEDMEMEEEAKRYLESKDSKEVLTHFIKELLEVESIDEDSLKRIFKNVSKKSGKKGKDLYMPIRVAVSFKMQGPELPIILPILGKDRIKKRIDKVLKCLKPSS